MKCKTGFKKVKGKCKKVSNVSRKSKSKKSNNPFKMRGSWVGGIVLFTIIFTLGNAVSSVFGGGIGLFEAIFQKPVFIVIFPIGFLIGWGIHSLIRRYKK